MKIYLASKSPRRKELLSQMGVEFKILPIDFIEEVNLLELPYEYSKRITEEKLHFAWNKLLQGKIHILPILCADTEVILDGKILGKPQNYEEAFNMLTSYSNHTHDVITTVGIKYLDFQKIITQVTKVTFAQIPESDIHKYLMMGDYKDKSGGYGIQSYIGQFISKIDGCFYSVMGLPLNTVRELLLEVNNYMKGA
mgnify:CR=1 FL=1